MMVSPELIRANSAPSARPLNTCDRRLGQLIIGGRSAPAAPNRTSPPWKTAKASRERRGRPRSYLRVRSGVIAELAAEGVRLLHQPLAGHDLDDVVEILVAL